MPRVSVAHEKKKRAGERPALTQPGGGAAQHMHRVSYKRVIENGVSQALSPSPSWYIVQNQQRDSIRGGVR